MMNNLYSLILSRSENDHANMIEKLLKDKGICVVRFNTDFPNNNFLKVGFIFDKTGKKVLKIDNLVIPAENIISIFSHIPRLEIDKKIGFDDLDRKIISSSWSNFIYNLEYFLPNAVWVNKVSSAHLSNNIFKQFQIANNLGLKTPELCFTNSLKELKRFQDVNKKIVYKTGSLLGVHFDKQHILVDLVDYKSVRASELIMTPTYFQKYIEKKHELRIHVIGNKVLTCRIESQSSPKASIDWRNYDFANTPHYPDKIDNNLESKLINLVKQLNLNVGIIDGIIDKNNEFYFLECNAHGHWLWIEALTGLRITEEIVNLLSN